MQSASACIRAGVVGAVCGIVWFTFGGSPSDCLASHPASTGSERDAAVAAPEFAGLDIAACPAAGALAPRVGSPVRPSRLPAVLDPSVSTDPTSSVSISPQQRSNIYRSIQAQEYFISPSTGGLQAPNRRQDLRVFFGSSGIDLVPRREVDSPWRASWRLLGWGRAECFHDVQDTPPEYQGPRVTYRRDGIVEWYENRPDGLEQGFTIRERVSGRGLLVIRASLAAGTSSKLRPDASAIDITDLEGRHLLSYSGLAARDAQGHSLPSRMTAGSEGNIVIEVDDTFADYPVEIDPVFATDSTYSPDPQAGAHFGCSVATAGDVNGDGFSDLLVGAPDYDGDGVISLGRVFVFFGSADKMSWTQRWILAPPANWHVDGLMFGYSVSSAGDVNRDGYDDFLVGAPGAFGQEPGHPALADAGAVVLYYGSVAGPNDPPTNPYWVWEGSQAGAELGTAVAYAGDVNGDGYADIAMSAPGYDGNRGGVWVLFGGEGGISVADHPEDGPGWGVEGDQIGARFGCSVATAGDLDADGYADFAIGAKSYTNPEGWEGKVFVYRGGSAGSLSLWWTAESNQSQSETYSAGFGTSVAGVGDVDGDGYADLLIGSPGYIYNATRGGAAFLYLGSPIGLGAAGTPSNADWAVYGTINAETGYSVAPAGDVNGDGYADVVIGSPGESAPGTGSGAGAARLYAGGPTQAAVGLTLCQQIIGVTGGDRMGHCVASAGDATGDGFGEIIVGASLADDLYPDEGGAWVLYGAGSLPATTAGWVAEGDQPSAYFGLTIAPAQDVNGDGFGDFLVCAPAFDHGEIDEGQVFLYLGGVGIPTLAWTAEGNQASAQMGSSATACDFNGDGYADIAIGSRRYSNGEAEEGAVFLFLGGPLLPAAPGTPDNAAWRIEGNQARGFLGTVVAWAGDVDADGYSDLLVGASGYTHAINGQGAVFLYRGAQGVQYWSPGSPQSAQWHVDGLASAVGMGAVAATAGDVDRDGYSDFLVSQRGYGAGCVDLYYGARSNQYQYVYVRDEYSHFAGDETHEYFGQSVASAGDVNGDGFSDILIGAPERSGTVPAGGAAYLYYGRLNGRASEENPLTADWSRVGSLAYGEVGLAVAGAGDVDGDGHSDILVATPGHSVQGSDVGLVSLYRGSEAGPLAEPWSVVGNQDNAGFGKSLAPAGDVNGDGFCDLLIGATQYSGGQSYEGRVELYYGNAQPGLARCPQQRHCSDLRPVAILGSNSQFECQYDMRLAGRLRTAAGRGLVWPEYEVRWLLYDEVWTYGRRPVFLDTGVPVFGLGSSVYASWEVGQVDLTHPLEPYFKWRYRVASNSPFFPRSPWLTLAWNSVTEQDYKIGGGGEVAVPDAPVSPKTAFLNPVVPNPAMSRAVVSFGLARTGKVRLSVIDVTGSECAVLLNEQRQAGSHTMAWDGASGLGGARLRAGVYWIRLEHADGVLTRKAVWLH